MTRPALSIWIVRLALLQSATAIGFEGVHDLLGSDPSFHNSVHMSRSNMHRVQTPTAVNTNLPNSSQHQIAAAFVEEIRRLIHQSELSGEAA